MSAAVNKCKKSATRPDRDHLFFKVDIFYLTRQYIISESVVPKCLRIWLREGLKKTSTVLAVSIESTS